MTLDFSLSLSLITFSREVTLGQLTKLLDFGPDHLVGVFIILNIHTSSLIEFRPYLGAKVVNIYHFHNRVITDRSA